ncbi:MAG: ribulose phosphate epimerase [Myxococcota bacterium]
MNRTLFITVIAALGLGCGTVDNNQGNEDSPAAATDDAAESTGAATPPESMTSETGAMSQGGSGSSDGADEETGAGFLQMPDGGGPEVECDVWEQDCPDGEKCMPWANDGGSAWNATRCSPVADNPGQVGDTCMVEGSGVAGIDDCDVGSMCYYVDGETNIGTCVSFCEGSPETPICEPGFLCSISNNGVLILCRATCDPLLQDCQDGAACLGAAGSDGFVCIVDASGEMGAPGDPCEFLNACDPGLFCANADAVPDCQGSGGCCSEFCDVTEPDPDAGCSLPGQMCDTWFEEGASPPGLEHVGACILPA